MANGQAPWDKGNGTFIGGSQDPTIAENLGNSISWIAVQPGVDKSKLDQYDAWFTATYHEPPPTHVVWEQPSSDAGMQAVKDLNAGGYIAGAEGSGQYDNAVANTSQLGDVPKAIYTNYPTIPSPDGTWPPGWDAMPEVYTNKDPNLNVSNRIDELKAAGAKDVVPIFGSYDATSEKNAAGYGGSSTYPIDSYINDSRRAGVRYFSTYAADTMSPADFEALRNYGNNPITGGPAGPGPHPSPSPNPNPNPKKKPPPTGTTPPKKPPTVAPAPNSGIDGRHFRPGTEGAPAAYTGGAPVNPDKNKTFSFTDKQGRKGTITTTSTGAEIEQVAGKNPYTIKKAAPPPGDASLGGPPPAAPKDNAAFAQAVDTATSSGKPPAWRSNSDWSGQNNQLDDKAAGLNPGSVLEERPGSNNRTVFRMADGSYKVFDPATGKTTDGGKWDNSGLAGTSGTQTTTQQTAQYFPPASGTPPGNTSGNEPAPSGGGVTDPTPTSSTPDSNPSYKTTTDVVPAGGCFPAGTMVLTPEGKRSIESLTVGDSVKSWDPETKQMVNAKITKTFEHPPEDTLLLVTQAGTVTTTAEHRFWTGSDWVPAGKLTPGNIHLFTSEGRLARLISVSLVNPQAVYNFHVENPNHNYFAEGLLVHNMKYSGDL